MKNITLMAVLAFVAGCGGKKSDTSPCADAVGKGVDQMIAMGKTRVDAAGSNVPPEMKARMEERAKKLEGTATQLKGVMTKRCTEDQWPDEVIKCYQAATSMQDIKTCRTKLPADQSAKLQSEVMQVMMTGMGGPGGMGGMGGPPGAPGGAGMGNAPHGQMTIPSGSDPGAAPPAPGSAGSAAPAAPAH